jgi:FkbM family methyltransferase
VLGRNREGRTVCQHFDLAGFVDDFLPVGSQWEGKPVLRSAELPPEAFVVNCSSSISPVSADRMLRRLPLQGVLSYADLCRKDALPLPHFVQRSREDLLAHPDRYLALAESLTDPLSRQNLIDLLHFRLTGDHRYMQAHSVRLDSQYFEPFLPLHDAIFVDGGGYDGDTTLELARRCDSYRKIFLFEPSQRNLENARQRLAGLRDVTCIPMALSHEVGQLSFDPELGSASGVSTNATEQVAATTLDHTIDEPVSLIKLDLEGWELCALQGATRHIREDHPALAVAIYHQPADFWRIRDFVLGLRSDYRLYLRHYSEGWSETVLFFIPEVHPE